MSDYALLFGPLAEHSQTIYFVYQVDARRVRYLSPAYERVLGGRTAHIDQELPRWLACLHPDDLEHLREQLLPLIRQEKSVVEDLELRLRHRDGRRQWLSLTACRNYDEAHGLLLSGTVRDVTATREYMSNADKFNAKKNATLEILAHDLAGPLVVVQQLAEHVADHSRSYQNAELNELVRLMHITCQDSVNLIRDFVNQEFLESANVELKRHRINLVAHLRALLESYRTAQHLLDKRILFTTAAEAVYVYIDDNKFQQVINNLISNALKFTPDGGRVEVRVQPLGGRVRISVQDNGIGIPARLQPMLFDKFTKARRPGLRGEKTTGLGMSIIRTLVNLHEGKIWFESQEGQGSTFHIELPTLPEDQSSSANM